MRGNGGMNTLASARIQEVAEALRNECVVLSNDARRAELRGHRLLAGDLREIRNRLERLATLLDDALAARRKSGAVADDGGPFGPEVAP